MKRKDAIIALGLLAAGCSGRGTAVPNPSPTPAPSTGPPTLRSMIAAGGVVTLPAGTWVVDDPPLTMPSGTLIRGAGIGQTIIKYTGATHLFHIASDNVALSDLTVDGSLCPGPAPFDTFDIALVMLEGSKPTLLRVAIQSSPSFGVFVHGSSGPTIQSCQFDDCGRLNGQDTLGGGPSQNFNTGVLYDSNVFTNCHGNAIDNCATIGTWSNNKVLSLAKTGPTAPNAGDISGDGGASVAVISNSLTVGSIQVYGATPGCLTTQGEPHGCQILNNVIKIGTLCGTPLCPGLYVVPGNIHRGNVIAGVLVD